MESDFSAPPDPVMLISDTSAHEIPVNIPIRWVPNAVLPKKTFHDTVNESFHVVILSRAATIHDIWAGIYPSRAIAGSYRPNAR
jgi:hypothetical protein